MVVLLLLAKAIEHGQKCRPQVMLSQQQKEAIYRYCAQLAII